MLAYLYVEYGLECEEMSKVQVWKHTWQYTASCIRHLRVPGHCSPPTPPLTLASMEYFICCFVIGLGVAVIHLYVWLSDALLSLVLNIPGNQMSSVWFIDGSKCEAKWVNRFRKVWFMFMLIKWVSFFPLGWYKGLRLLVYYSINFEAHSFKPFGTGLSLIHTFTFSGMQTPHRGELFSQEWQTPRLGVL